MPKEVYRKVHKGERFGNLILYLKNDNGEFYIQEEDGNWYAIVDRKDGLFARLLRKQNLERASMEEFKMMGVRTLMGYGKCLGCKRFVIPEEEKSAKGNSHEHAEGCIIKIINERPEQIN